MEGINGKRSRLWKEFKRLIKDLGPNYAIIENVANLRSKGLVTVLQDLWEIGYDAEWHIIPAWAVGAIHRRERIWIVAYPNQARLPEFERQEKRGPGARLNSIPLQEGPRERNTHNTYICRGDDAIPGRVDRIKQLGNSVVPQIPELIGREIIADQWG
jgi:DNA (cytosine-5)-methyltransferase 1